MDPGNTDSITLPQLVNGYRYLLGVDRINRNVARREVSW
jgi:hypothetical protein